MYMQYTLDQYFGESFSFVRINDIFRGSFSPLKLQNIYSAIFVKHNFDRSFLILFLAFYLLTTGIKRFTTYFDINVTIKYILL